MHVGKSADVASGGFRENYIRLRNANKTEPTLSLKPRGDVTRNPKRGTSGPKIGHVNVSDIKNFKKKQKQQQQNNLPGEFLTLRNVSFLEMSRSSRPSEPDSSIPSYTNYNHKPHN